MSFKKSVFVAFITLIVGGSVLYAQSKSDPKAEELVKRAENLAVRFENLEKRMRTPPASSLSDPEARERSISSQENSLIKELDTLEDESTKLSTDLSYAPLTGITFTDSQNNRLLDATRRITNASSQIQRNYARWSR